MRKVRSSDFDQGAGLRANSQSGR